MYELTIYWVGGVKETITTLFDSYADADWYAMMEGDPVSYYKIEQVEG